MAGKGKFKYRDSAAKRKQRSEARANGRGNNAAYTAGAREVGFPKDPTQLNKDAWSDGKKIDTYSSSVRGRMNDGRINPKTGNKLAGGVTHSFTQKDDDGNVIRQSSRGMLSRRKRYYEVRRGLGMSGG